jgi:hypothetical protein
MINDFIHEIWPDLFEFSHWVMLLLTAWFLFFSPPDFIYGFYLMTGKTGLYKPIVAAIYWFLYVLAAGIFCSFIAAVEKLDQISIILNNRLPSDQLGKSARIFSD